MDFETSGPEGLKGGAGNYLTKPGTYHFSVDEVLDGCYASGKPIAGGGVTLKLTNLSEAENGRSTSITLHMPKLTSKDKGESSRKKLSAFLVATNLAAPEQLGGSIKADPKAAAGTQIVAELELGEPQEGTGKQYLELKFWNLYHVDDPRVPAACLNQSALAAAIYPADKRRPASYFDPILKAATTATNGHAKAAAPQRQAVTADDL